MNDFDHSPPTPGCIAAIIPAAGSGQRFGSEQNKLFADLAGKPLWYHSAARLRQQSLIGRIVMPVSQTDHEVFTGKFAKWVSELEIEIVLGGDQRTDSVLAGLDKLAGDEKRDLLPFTMPQGLWLAKVIWLPYSRSPAKTEPQY